MIKKTNLHNRWVTAIADKAKTNDRNAPVLKFSMEMM